MANALIADQRTDATVRRLAISTAGSRFQHIHPRAASQGEFPSR